MASGFGAFTRAGWARWDLWSRRRLRTPGIVPVAAALVAMTAGTVVLALPPTAGQAHPVAVPAVRPTVSTVAPTPAPKPKPKPVAVDPLDGMPVPKNVPAHPVLPSRSTTPTTPARRRGWISRM